MPILEQRVVSVCGEASEAGWGQPDGNALPRYWGHAAGLKSIRVEQPATGAIQRF